MVENEHPNAQYDPEMDASLKSGQARSIAEDLTSQINELGAAHGCLDPKLPRRFRDPPLGPEDPWKHRSQKMKCSSCMWFVFKGSGTLGRCRRRAPTMAGYPAVFVTDWCGDHKVDETKI